MYVAQVSSQPQSEVCPESHPILKTFTEENQGDICYSEKHNGPVLDYRCPSKCISSSPDYEPWCITSASDRSPCRVSAITGDSEDSKDLTENLELQPPLPKENSGEREIDDVKYFDGVKYYNRNSKAKFRRVEGWMDCMGHKDIYYCLPSQRPKMCKDDAWIELNDLVKKGEKPGLCEEKKENFDLEEVQCVKEGETNCFKRELYPDNPHGHCCNGLKCQTLFLLPSRCLKDDFETKGRSLQTKEEGEKQEEETEKLSDESEKDVQINLNININRDD